MPTSTNPATGEDVATYDVEKCAWACRYYADHGRDHLAVVVGPKQ